MAGKGDKRRPEAQKGAYDQNYDRIFKPKPTKKQGK